MRGSQTVRCALATLTIAAACTAAAIPSTSLRASVRSADSDLSVLQQRVDRLDALTQRVEAVSAIKRLQHAYGHYSELGLWHDFADSSPTPASVTTRRAHSIAKGFARSS